MRGTRCAFSGAFPWAFLAAGLSCVPCFGTTEAYYRFEEGTAGTAATGTGTIPDSSGNGLSGTPVGLPVYSSNVPSTPFQNNLSMDFNGNDWISLPDYPQLELTQSLTLEAYVNVSSVNSGNGQYIIFRGDNRPGLDPYTLQVQIRSNLPEFVFAVTDASGNTAFVNTPIPSMNLWYEVAGTLNATSGKLDLYLNGVLDASATTSIRPFGGLDSTQDPGLGIGNLEDPDQGNVSMFNGLIDEARISNQALTPSEQLENAPEPGSMGLLGIGAISLMRRQRGKLKRGEKK